MKAFGKTLAEDTDKILMVKINMIAHSYTMFYWACHAISLKPGQQDDHIVMELVCYCFYQVDAG